MKPVTYLCFTLFSILIQFCLMDFINERSQTDDVITDDKGTVAKNSSNVINKIIAKPHALYYRNMPQIFGKKINKTQAKIYSNSSLSDPLFQTSTDFTSTLFDFLYDENISTTDSTLTPDTYYNGSEYDNVTEITFFDNKKTPKSSDTPNNRVTTNICGCNLMFNKCDINCCCDNECSDPERNLFKNCKEGNNEQCFNFNKKLQYYCFFQDTCSGELTSNMFAHYFCIEKVNLPDKSRYKNKLENIDINKYFKWHTNKYNGSLYKFEKIIYLYNQPVWLLKNETLDIISLPITVGNSYCSGKKPIKFLTNEHIKCYVKIKDLHFLYALQISTDSTVVSPTEITTNSTTWNCSTFHCTNWTTLVCNNHNCISYNKSLHEPSCSENHCNNIAVKVEYIFHCNESIITKATLKFHVKQLSTDIAFVSQKVLVTFYMGNDSIDDIIKYSGNPGYIRRLPIIASFVKSNHTKQFYNRTLGKSNNILLPYNQNGECVITNITHNIVKFGINTRLKCRLTLEKKNAIHNITDVCLKIQMEIFEMLRLNNNIFISPYGNPNNMSDSNWISLQRFNKSNIYGEYRAKKFKLQCYNLITRFAYILTYADSDGVSKEENHILSGRIEGTTKNVTISVKDFSTVITVDTNFINVNMPSIREYIEAPLNTHFLKNSFLPFRSHSCKCIHHTFFLYLCTILFLSK